MPINMLTKLKPLVIMCCIIDNKLKAWTMSNLGVSRGSHLKMLVGNSLLPGSFSAHQHEKGEDFSE